MPAARQLSFNYLLGNQEWFTIQETAKIIGMSVRFVENLFDEGEQLSGHEHNGGNGHRNTKKIPRAWIEAYLVKTAAYDFAMKLQMACSVIDAFQGDTEALCQLRNHLTHHITH